MGNRDARWFSGRGAAREGYGVLGDCIIGIYSHNGFPRRERPSFCHFRDTRRAIAARRAHRIVNKSRCCIDKYKFLRHMLFIHLREPVPR